MKATGTLFLSRAKPYISWDGDGEFLLTLCAVNRIGPRKVEPYRLTWSGAKAKNFYTATHTRLVPGAVLQVELSDVRTHTIAIGQTEITAEVNTITVSAEAQKEAA